MTAQPKPPVKLTTEVIRLTPNGSGLKQEWSREAREYWQKVAAQKDALKRVPLAPAKALDDFQRSASIDKPMGFKRPGKDPDLER